MAKKKSGESNPILIVDDQPEVRNYVRNVLEERGNQVLEAGDAEEGLRIYRETADSLSLVILDLDFGVGATTGLDILREMKEIRDEIPVMILTGKGSASEGAEAIRLGAADVLEKDLYIEQNLDASVEKISRLMQVVEENRRLVAENARLREMTDFYESEFRRKYTMVGESPAFSQVVDEARRIANVPRPVLIRGERGTGKELAAALIHYSSDRHDKPFITVNCAAFHGNLLESEIFGHEKGAFTGADKRKIGRFELADGGTLFLDEIGNMALEFQEKILRVLEYQKFERVAGTETISVDVRLVAATNAELETMMKEGTFRPDLYDRLSFKVLKLPPLRDRREDVPMLVEHFRKELIREVPWVAERKFVDASIEVLQNHDWPGNIRELKNVVERLLCGGDKPKITAAEVRMELGASSEVAASTAETFHEKISELEISLLLEALRATGGNQRAAADQLSLTYDQLRHLYKKYDLKERLAQG
ncbi:MAG: sigma-54 dependent transcriptional regulator [Planctomycetota bacterium]